MGGIAFYAPLKSPHHRVPSGEREIARNFITLLTVDGVPPVLASELRSLEKTGDAARQSALITEAAAEAERLVARGRREGWQAWLTYHSYYKAPDLLGPLVTQRLGIPYVLAEATLASKRLGGPWDGFERKAMAACDAADVIFHFTERDAVALRASLTAQKLRKLPPFLALEALPAQAAPLGPTILVAAMMRAGDKLASYQIIVQTLARLPDAPWSVEIAGDGPMRGEVAALMAPFGARVRFLGQLDAAGMAQAFGRARAFLWPGVNEAFGMVYLEAQARGVPVVAEARPGVQEVVETDGLVAPDAPEQLAAALWRVLSEPAYHETRARAARDLVAAQHLLPAARVGVWSALRRLKKERS